MNSFETRNFGEDPQTSTTGHVVQIQVHPVTRAPARTGYLRPSELVARVGAVVGDQKLREARAWLSDAYVDSPNSLRALRLRAGFSQTELAAAIGASQAHLSRIEAGKCDIQLRTARRLSEALDVDMNTIDAAIGPAAAE